MTTIDEAIAHAREAAEISRGNIIPGSNLDGYEAYCNAKCEECAEEHEQIAEWLEELKVLKSEPIDCGSDLGKAYYYNLGRENGYSKAENDYHAQSEKDRQSSYNCGYEVGYAKAIDVACEYLKCEWAVDNLQTCDDFDKIAEKLKAGEK